VVFAIAQTDGDWQIMELVISTPKEAYGFSPQARIYGIYQDYWQNLLRQDQRLRGRVLDVGCREKPGAIQQQEVVKMAAQCDGVDPDESVLRNPFIKERWHGFFDDAPVPEGAYDAVVAFLVVEHVTNPETFLKAAFRALKPGGVFYATTPHRWHPFPMIVTIFELTKIKYLLSKGNKDLNDYPAYYRLNSAGAVRKFAQQAGFKRAEVIYHPARFEKYFPKPLRFLGVMYDWLLGYRFRACTCQIMIKLEK
jgi:2-polyprenyl-3-methyl-5-hydroxy-6-metoxy-1,4-benzoquinol methylase